MRELVEAVNSEPLCSDLRVAIVAYRDHPPEVALILITGFHIGTISLGFHLCYQSVPIYGRDSTSKVGH